MGDTFWGMGCGRWTFLEGEESLPWHVLQHRHWVLFGCRCLPDQSVKRIRWPDAGVCPRRNTGTFLCPYIHTTAVGGLFAKPLACKRQRPEKAGRNHAHSISRGTAPMPTRDAHQLLGRIKKRVNGQHGDQIRQKPQLYSQLLQWSLHNQ